MAAWPGMAVWPGVAAWPGVAQAAITELGENKKAFNYYQLASLSNSNVHAYKDSVKSIFEERKLKRIAIFIAKEKYMW